MNRKVFSVTLCLIIVSLAGCNSKTNESQIADITSDIELDTSISTDIISFDDDDYYNEKTSDSTKIILGTPITVSGQGAKVDETVVTISEGGIYTISGTLNNGKIIVAAGKNDNVNIVLDNANITCLDDSPIYISSANKVIISLANDSTNSVTDSANYNSDSEASAAIYSKSDLTINGSGKLIVNAKFNNAIQSKDSLKILNGTIEISSVDDGIIGKDEVQILGGNINIDAGGDGIKSTNEEETELGYVAIKGGNINIVAGSDGIQAKNSLVIDDGTFNITTGGGSSVSNLSKQDNMWSSKNKKNTDDLEESNSTKGLKASESILITSGNFTINSSDDAIHSNNSVIIENGNLEIASGDDGIHADTAISINGGNINIAKSYEGIESASVLIAGGNINVVASDDGINVAGGNDGSSINGRPGQNSFTESNNENKLYITGGYLNINASGDGLDANGSIYMSDGIVIVNGPTNDGNGALDYDRVFEITGGELIASGSAGMMQSVSSSSAQCGVSIVFNSTNKAGTNVTIKDENGNEIINTTPTKDYRSIVVSNPEFKIGSSYTIYVNNTEYSSFTINDTLTSIGSSMRNDRNMPQRRR